MAKKKSVTKKKAGAPAARPGAHVAVIDYPQEREAVRPGHYSVRLTAAGCHEAQVRFDGGEWSNCREAVGHFWHDWVAAPGKILLQARARKSRGRWSAVSSREVSISDV